MTVKITAPKAPCYIRDQRSIAFCIVELVCVPVLAID
jgi:hypothetical protein